LDSKKEEFKSVGKDLASSWVESKGSKDFKQGSVWWYSRDFLRLF
jgi:hypothetical protein